MADRSTHRELQKNRLKRQIISGEEPQQREARPGIKLSRKVLLAALLVLLLLAVGVSFYVTHKNSKSFGTVWKKDLGSEGQKADSFQGYLSFGGGLLRYSKDGAVYYDGDGKAVWERSYQMNEPAAAVSEQYAVITDQGGNSIYVFSRTANTGVATTVLPVTKAVVSDTGVVYAILRDKSAEYITAFNYDGSPIDLSVKSVITGDGYPLDLAVSPDGTQLVTSYVALENGSLKSKVIFRNFGEVGQNADARRIVGGFSDEFTGHLVGRVHFSGETAVQAFYDGGIAFFSTKVLTSPALTANVTFEQRMRSIACGEKYVAVILEQTEGDVPYLLQIYDTSGMKRGETGISYAYTSFEVAGSSILLYGADGLHVYRPNGRERAALDMTDVQLEKVAQTKLPWEYLVAGGTELMRIRLE